MGGYSSTSSTSSFTREYSKRRQKGTPEDDDGMIGVAGDRKEGFWGMCQ
jgi:hypothetical protein